MKTTTRQNFLRNVAVLTAAVPFIILSHVYSNPPGNPVAMDYNSARMEDISEPVVETQKIYYVDVNNGDDKYSGGLAKPNNRLTDGPFQTIEKAKNEIRNLKSKGQMNYPVKVVIRGGVCHLTKTLVFTSDDSGSEEFPISYTAYEGENPIISGGRRITGWKKGDGELWKVHLPEVEKGEWYFAQLFVDGQRRIRPRLPKEGFYHVADLLEQRSYSLPSHYSSAKPEDKNLYQGFRFYEGEIKQWDKLEDVEVVSFHAWADSRLKVESIDPDENKVHFDQRTTYSFTHGGKNQRYYVDNVFEAISAGEWYLDRSSGNLFYYPLPGENPEEKDILAPVLNEIITLEGDENNYVENISFSGLTFSYAAADLPEDGYRGGQAHFPVGAALSATGAKKISIKNCTVSHVGRYGIWFKKDCHENRIENNVVHDLGAGGIRLGENPSDELSKDASNNIVSNNHVYDGGKVYHCSVGILVAKTHRNTISHNEVHDFNYTGISIGWHSGGLASYNTVEYNHIHSVMQGMFNDGAGIYTLQFNPGTVIRNNLIHDVHPYTHLGIGIYLDNSTTGVLVENNIVYRTERGVLYKGQDNIIQNNIFAFGKDNQLDPHTPNPNRFERNIVYFSESRLFRRTEWNYHEPQQRLGYPYFDQTIERVNMKNMLSLFDYNLYYSTDGKGMLFYDQAFKDWQELGFDKHSKIADPLFIDAEGGNFTLKSGSPAFELGFQPIDISKVGLIE